MVEDTLMIYLWVVPENFLNKDIGEYDQDCSPESYLLYTAKFLENNEFSPIPTIHFEISKKRASQFDCLPNSTLVPLVNKRIKHILEKLSPNNVQFFPAKVICSDGELESYYFLNITRSIIGIDHEKSVYSKIIDAICKFKYLTYKTGSMGEYNIARDQEYKPNLLISETIKSEFEQERISGVRFVRPEDFYSPLSASDLINEYKRDSE